MLVDATWREHRWRSGMEHIPSGKTHLSLAKDAPPKTFFALWGAEVAAIANPVNYFLDPAQIAGIVKEAGARAPIADGSLFPDIWQRSRRSTPRIAFATK
jgi:hypothetical protein